MVRKDSDLYEAEEEFEVESTTNLDNLDKTGKECPSEETAFQFHCDNLRY